MLRGSGTGIDFSDESGSITCNRSGGINDCAWATPESWLMAIPTAPRTATARKATAILMVVIFIRRGCKLVVPFMFHLEELLKPTRSLCLPSVFSPRNPLDAGFLGLSTRYFAYLYVATRLVIVTAVECVPSEVCVPIAFTIPSCTCSWCLLVRLSRSSTVVVLTPGVQVPVAVLRFMCTPKISSRALFVTWVFVVVNNARELIFGVHMN